jgi:hypothetical protein
MHHALGPCNLVALTHPWLGLILDNKKLFDMEDDMDNGQLAEMTRWRLKLDDQEWTIVKENPKFQCLFKNAIEASKYRLVVEVIESKGCHSGHVIGQKLIFDNSGNLLTKGIRTVSVLFRW